MEALRLRGNAFFAHDAAQALPYYLQAMQLYEDGMSTATTTATAATVATGANAATARSLLPLSEYTKCAGNALTCLYKLRRHGECMTTAMRALGVSPALAKAYVFLARCLLDTDSDADGASATVTAAATTTATHGDAHETRDTSAVHADDNAVDDRRRVAAVTTSTSTSTTASATAAARCAVVAAVLSPCMPAACCCQHPRQGCSGGGGDACAATTLLSSSNDTAMHGVTRDTTTTTTSATTATAAWMCLCRAIYLLPELSRGVLPYMRQALHGMACAVGDAAALRRCVAAHRNTCATAATCATRNNNNDNDEDNNTTDDATASHALAASSSSSSSCAAATAHDTVVATSCVRLSPCGAAGNGVVARVALPAFAVVAYTQAPFSVCVYGIMDAPAPYNNHRRSHKKSSHSDDKRAHATQHVDDTDSSDADACVLCCIRCGDVLDDDDEDDGGGGGSDDDDARRHVCARRRCCVACGVAHYCSAQCARAHDAQHRNYECAAMQRLRRLHHALTRRQPRQGSSGGGGNDDDDNPGSAHMPDAFVDVAVHVITTLASMRARRPGAAQLLQLCAHADEVAQALHPTVTLLQQHVLQPSPPPPSSSSSSSSSTTQTVSASVVAAVTGIVYCNAMRIATRSGQAVGQALYAPYTRRRAAADAAAVDAADAASSSFVCDGDGDDDDDDVVCASHYNHSCAPNCAVDEVRGVVATTRRVCAGEELTIAYIPQLYWPRALRREQLAERYFFTCRCSRCRTRGNNNSGSGGISSSDGDDATNAFERALQLTRASPAQRRAGDDAGDGGARGDAGSATTARARMCAWHARVQLTCARLRALCVREVQSCHLDELQQLSRDVSADVFPFHYLMHDMCNTRTFLHAVRGDTAATRSCCLREWLLWECLLPGALPVKQLKLCNALACMQTGRRGSNRHRRGSRGTDDNHDDNDDDSGDSALLPLIDEVAALYRVTTAAAAATDCTTPHTNGD